MKQIVKIFDSPEKLFLNTAQLTHEILQSRIDINGSCSFVLSGGSTPRSLYTILGSEYKNKTSWDRVCFFWGDERCVPPDNDESNYKMAYDTLISRINISEKNVHRMPAEKPHHKAALEYELLLKMLFSELKYPSFDLVMLGLGEDGHTASLFNAGDMNPADERWVKDVYSEKFDKWRITMTLPVFNNAKNIIFLVSGKNKAGIVKSVLEEKNKLLPAEHINTYKGDLIWCLDKEAASMINP